MVEDGDPAAREVMRRLYRHTGRAHVVGLTGSPGSGKSTLACALAGNIRAQGLSVGIICVDPSSPFTGGALLGDRVRMQELAGDPGVFIRSMGSRGALGGLSVAINDAINILDAFGSDYILVETVGAGQVEIEVVKYAHTCVVVMMPGGGDEIQAIKAGILEIGDIFVVNKSDRQGAERTMSDIEMMIEMTPAPDAGSWRPPVLLTAALESRGIEELAAALEAHKEHLEASGRLASKVEERMKAELLEILSMRVSSAAIRMLEDSDAGRDLARRMTAREIAPHDAADEVIRRLRC